MSKFYNNALVGNGKFVASFSDTGELLRACYPNVDGRQFVDYFRAGLKINDSNVIYFHKDINNKYNQKYVEDTNVLITEINNMYFSLNIMQMDCVMIDDNIMIKKYIFKNNNNIEMNLKFCVDSKILSSNIEKYGSRVFDEGIVQYNHNYSFSIFSNQKIEGHKLNDVQSNFESGDFVDKDYIGMSNEVAISYNLGILKPGEQREFVLYILIEDTPDCMYKVYKTIKMNSANEISKIELFWKKYVQSHKKFLLKSNNDYDNKIMEIYTRTILLYPLLTNKETGGIAAAMEVDENREKSGSYSYCWTRDSIFITKALNILNMEDETKLFYNNFCRNTQSSNGMWEQRFYTDKTLAPCWGYQIDETASVIYGVWDYYKFSNDKSFLEQNLKMCESAIKFLYKYIENILNIDEVDLVKKDLEDKYSEKFEIHKQISYDLWEMNEGIHLYSLSSIASALHCMVEIYNVLDSGEHESRLKKEKRLNTINKLEKYANLIENFIKDNLIDKEKLILKRNTNDNNMDISVMGAVYPFNIFASDDRVIKNTVDKINMTLKTYSNGYLRFEGDSYMEGKNPWVITTLWMALYYMESENVNEAEKCFKYVVETACKHGFLSEQVSNEDSNFKWVIGLGWSHAMFIIVLNELIKRKRL